MEERAEILQQLDGSAYQVLVLFWPTTAQSDTKVTVNHTPCSRAALRCSASSHSVWQRCFLNTVSKVLHASHTQQVSAGGSLSNTLLALARMGRAEDALYCHGALRVAFDGIMGGDALSAFYTVQMRDAGVSVLAEPGPNSSTGEDFGVYTCCKCDITSGVVSPLWQGHKAKSVCSICCLIAASLQRPDNIARKDIPHLCNLMHRHGDGADDAGCKPHHAVVPGHAGACGAGRSARGGHRAIPAPRH